MFWEDATEASSRRAVAVWKRMLTYGGLARGMLQATFQGEWRACRCDEREGLPPPASRTVKDNGVSIGGRRAILYHARWDAGSCRLRGSRMQSGDENGGG